jgi:hypothetical protein
MSSLMKPDQAAPLHGSPTGAGAGMARSGAQFRNCPAPDPPVARPQKTTRYKAPGSPEKRTPPLTPLAGGPKQGPCSRFWRGGRCKPICLSRNTAWRRCKGNVETIGSEAPEEKIAFIASLRETKRA